MPEFVIRAARPGDEHRIFELLVALARYEKLEHEVTGSPEALARDLFEPPVGCEVLVAESGGEMVGYALFFSTYSTFLTQRGIHLEDLFVLPEHRGRGIGKALLAALATETMKRRGGRLEWAVLDWNQPAISFYESLGAVPMSEWTTYRLTGEALRRFAGEST